MVIEFGSWQLRPCDALNWQLWHRHETSSGRDAGKVKWHPTGRFYSWSTFDSAFEFAADFDARERDGAFSPWEFLDEYRRCLRSFEASLRHFEKSILRRPEGSTEGD